LVEITSRTLEGRHFLHPDPWMAPLVVGVLARAQRKYGVSLHTFVFLSNHFHLLATFQDARQESLFMAFVKAQLAKRIRRIRGHTGEVVWGNRYSSVLVSPEPQAQTARLLYHLRQGVKEGLVADPLDWPGPSSWRAMLTGAPLVGYWLPLSALNLDCPPDFSSPKAEEEHLVLTPLPAWSHLPEAVRQQNLLDLLEVVRSEGEQQLATSRTTDPVRLAPLDLRPRPAPKRSGFLPLVHAFSRRVRQLFERAYREFVRAYRKAADALKKGIPGVAFPEGSFPRPAPFIPYAPA
jgi:REP element-mobilizing transposase RayT